MGAPAVPARRRWRGALLAWHRWFGLLAAVWLLLLAATGCAITFYDELDTWLNPELRRVPAQTAAPAAIAPAAIPLQRAIDAARAAVPGFAPNHVELPNAPGQSLWMIGRAGGRPVQVFADPRDGRVLGWRASDTVSLHRRHLMDLLYGLHVDLQLGPFMTTVFGLVALCWLIDHFAALWLAVPRLTRWREAFAVGGRAGSLRRLFDLHRAPGLWLLPATLILALTGLTLAWPEASRDAIRLVSPVSERLDFELPDAAADAPAAIDADQALALAAPAGGIDSLRLLPRKGAYAVRSFDPRDVDDQGRLWTYVSMHDGSLLGQRHDRGDSAGDLFFVWQYALHSGKAFGLTGRLVVLAAGAATALLCVTGVLLWMRRRRRPAVPPEGSAAARTR